MATLYNPTPGPVFLDDGACLGGGERIEHNLTKIVRAHIDAGRLVEVKGDEPAATKDATAKEKR